MNDTAAVCNGNYYAGGWASDSGTISCSEALSGPAVSSSINTKAIEDDDGNKIGIKLQYIGSPSGTYVNMNIYCSHDMDF